MKLQRNKVTACLGEEKTNDLHLEVSGRQGDANRASLRDEDVAIHQPRQKQGLTLRQLSGEE